MSRRLGFVLSLIVVLGAVPIAVAAQQTGTIAGRVTSSGGQPLSDVRVQIVGTTRGALSGPDGTYRITAVTPGVALVRAIRIGYGAQSRTVTVAAAQTVAADFSLSESAAILEQVVVTATGQTERRRESGATIATIDTSAVQLAAVTNLSQLLTSRASGVTVQSAAGSTGASSRIRIRGSNSISLNNDPLLIIDGVRVNNSTNSTSIGVGGQVPSRFNDINPEEIETIDVIKGPAASALYGTAAANGVIQVTTKKGRAGRTRWDAFLEGGTLYDVNTYPGNFLRFGTRLRANGQDSLNAAGNRVITNNCNIDFQARRICRPDSLVTTNPLQNVSPFRTGSRRNGGVAAAGGTQNNTYFLAAELEQENGIYPVNHYRRLNLRTNLRSQLTPAFDVAMTIGYLSSDLRQPQNDNNLFGYIASGILGLAADCSPTNRTNYPTICGSDSLSRGYAATVPPTTLFVINTRQQVSRTTGSATANWQALSWLSFNAVLGGDLANRFDHETTPPNIIPVSASTTANEGYRQANRAVLNTYTANATATGTYDITTTLRSTTALGVQYNDEYSTRTDGFGARLLAGTSSLAGTNARFAVNETTNDNKTLGFLAREQLAWRDRLFVTAAARTDRNSAFGENFGWVVYPAFNVSWVASDEGFFPRIPTLSTLRLRAGYGASGQRPGFRDPVVFFDPVAVNIGGTESPAFTRANQLGNVDLKPEFSTEIDAGFDLTVLDNRLNLEYSHYDKITKNALVQVTLAPSLGAGNTTWQNLGRVRNWGDEISVRAAVLQDARVSVDLNANFAFNKNRLEELGVDPQGNPLPPIFQGFSATQRIQNGYPLGGYFQRKYTFQDANGDGMISRVNCGIDPLTSVRIGPDVAGGPACEISFGDTASAAQYLGTPFPTREINFSPVVRIGDWLQLQALIDHRGGQKILNATRDFRCTSAFQNCRDVADPQTTSLEDQAKAIATLALQSRAGYIEDASFTKLREVSATFRVPQRYAQRLNAAAASLTIAGRNLKTWTKYSGLDPEVNALPTGNFTTADFLTQPQIRYITARLALSF